MAAGPPRLAESRLGTIPVGPENLALRAIDLLAQSAGVRPHGHLALTKRIPSAAGLGGGSSDAAAALLIANIAWGLHLPLSELAGIAAELGSDVPFFLFDGWAICRGRGERLESVESPGSLFFVVCRPPEGLSTARVYANSQVPKHPRMVGPVLRALHSGDMRQVRNLLWNRLQPTARKFSPWVDRLAQEFDLLDCVGHQMTGSGTGYFGIFRHARHARRAANEIRSRESGGVYVAQCCN